MKLERAIRLKKRMKLWGLKAKDVSAHCSLATDTIRAMGRQKIADGSLDEIENAIEQARRLKMTVLQSAG